MTLYVLSAVCGALYLLTVVLDDTWSGLAVACFVLAVLAIVTDRDLEADS